MRPLSVALPAIVVIVVGTTSYFAFLPHAHALSSWMLAAGSTLVLGGAAAAWAKHEELLSEWLTPRWGDFTRGAVAGVLFFAVAWAFSRWVAAPGSSRAIWLPSLYSQLGNPRVLQEHAPAVALTVLVAAAGEEIVWRGVVTQVLAERVGSRVAWLWAALLYAAAYVPTAWALRAGVGPAGGLNPVLPLAALAGGLLWGAMARALGRLVPGILAHALFDWAVVMMFPLWGMG